MQGGDREREKVKEKKGEDTQRESGRANKLS